MKTLQSDDQAQMARGAVSLVVALLLVGLIGSVLLPIGVDAIAGDTQETINQSTSETAEINAYLNVTLDSVSSGTSATYTVNQTDGSSISKTVNVGSNETFALERGDVTINVSSTTTSTATSTVKSPPQFAFGDGARAIWGILDVIIVLGLFLFVISVALAGLSRT